MIFVESKVADFDVKEAVKLLCSETSFAPTNEDTINKFKKKTSGTFQIFKSPTAPPSGEESFQSVPAIVKESIMSFA